MSNSNHSDSVYLDPQSTPMKLPSLQVTRHGKLPQVVKPYEARVAARGIFDRMVLTSPNMDYVPEYPVECSSIDLYSDGRYGRHEYSRWPQDLKRDMWHIACIPSRPMPPDVPAVLWETLLPETHWVREGRTGFTDGGYIVKETRDALLSASTTIIRRYEEMKIPDSGDLAKHGRLLVMILQQVRDRMRFNPVSAKTAIYVAAHLQRVCLELAGLNLYVEVVQPRLLSTRDYSTSVLPVLGAFVTDSSDVHKCVRVGLPIWVLRPLTHELAVWHVVECRTASFGRSIERLTGVSNPTKDWLRNMLLLVTEHVSDTHLTSMDIAKFPEVLGAVEENPSKRRRVGYAATSQSYSSQRRYSKGGRSTPQNVVSTLQAPSAGSSPESALLHRHDSVLALAPSNDTHPSKTFTPSPFYDIAPVWATALQSASPVCRTLTSAAYFYPPPFLFDTVSSIAPLPTPCAHPERSRTDEKVHRYLHNFARIREFCRIRIFDVTITSRPLTIEEWRHALWGDFRPIRPYVPSKPSYKRGGRSARRYEDRKHIWSLFGAVGHLPPYREDEVVTLQDMHVDIPATGSNRRVREFILWETHEVNFRAELLCLDALMVQKPTWSYRQKLEREFLVSRVWGPPSSIMHIFPYDGPRASRMSCWWSPPPSSQWQDCCETLRHFATVLSSWPDCPDDVGQGLPHQVPEEVFERVLAHAVHFYVHVFVKTFGRLPTPPGFVPSM